MNKKQQSYLLFLEEILKTVLGKKDQWSRKVGKSFFCQKPHDLFYMMRLHSVHMTFRDFATEKIKGWTECPFILSSQINSQMIFET